MFKYHFGEDMYFHSLYNLNYDFFNLVLAGKTNPNPNYFISHNQSEKFSQYDFYIIEQILDGIGYLHIDNTKHVLSAGDFILIKRGVPHHYYSDKENPYTKLFLVLNGSVINSLLHCYNLDKNLIKMKQDFSDIFHQVFMLVDNKKSIDISLNFELTIIFHRLIHNMANKQKLYKNRTISPAEEIKVFLDRNFTSDITLSGLAKIFNFAPQSIIRIFKEKYHKTPIAYLNEKRLEYAHDLLTQTNHSITHIANLCGLTDPKYLSKQIKQKYGASPKAIAHSPTTPKVD